MLLQKIFRFGASLLSNTLLNDFFLQFNNIGIRNHIYEMAINIDSTEVDLIWLRDNCRCRECYNWDSNQRNLNDIKINQSQLRTLINEGNEIFVTWVDGHESKYNLEWIKTQHQPESRLDEVLWSGREIENEIPVISNEESSEQIAKLLTKSLLRYGIGLVTHVPATMEATEKTVNKLGPVMHTIYGGMWSLKNTQGFEQYQDTAYSNQELSAHTDNTYFIEPAGLQVFHCFQNAEQGGETILVDGFNAANTLKNECEMSYDCLRTTPVEWQYISDQHHYTCMKPMINVFPRSDKIEQIRYNIYDRSPRVSFSNYDQKTFYSSLKRFRDIINKTNNQWKLLLNPGTVLFINNWRVLHGRKTFVGTRVLAGCYMGMNALRSKARILKLVK